MKFLRQELFAPKVLLFCGESWEQNKQKAPNRKSFWKCQFLASLFLELSFNLNFNYKLHQLCFRLLQTSNGMF